MYHRRRRNKVRSTFDQVSRGKWEPMLAGMAPRFSYRFYGEHALSGERHTLMACAVGGTKRRVVPAAHLCGPRSHSGRQSVGHADCHTCPNWHRPGRRTVVRKRLHVEHAHALGRITEIHTLEDNVANAAWTTSLKAATSRPTHLLLPILRQFADAACAWILGPFHFLPGALAGLITPRLVEQDVAQLATTWRSEADHLCLSGPEPVRAHGTYHRRTGQVPTRMGPLTGEAVSQVPRRPPQGALRTSRRGSPPSRVHRLRARKPVPYWASGPGPSLVAEVDAPAMCSDALGRTNG